MKTSIISVVIESPSLLYKIWQCVKTLYPFCSHQNSWDLWMFIPLKMVLIGIDPYPFLGDWTKANRNHQFLVRSIVVQEKLARAKTNRDGRFFYLTYDTYVSNKSFNFILYMTLPILDTWHFFKLVSRYSHSKRLKDSQVPIVDLDFTLR